MMDTLSLAAAQCSGVPPVCARPAQRSTAAQAESQRDAALKRTLEDRGVSAAFVLPAAFPAG